MKSGEKLNALVAEKIMGWTYGEILGEKYLVPPGTLNTLIEEMNVLDQRGWNSLSIQIPGYSTDISAAWKVLEKCHEMGFVWCFEQADTAAVPTIHIMNPLSEEEKASSLVHYIEDMEKISQQCDSPPHAICIAALRALGHKL